MVTQNKRLKNNEIVKMIEINEMNKTNEIS